MSLRFKVLAKGSKSLYLDTYWNGSRHYEFLMMYLIPERDEQDRLTNQATLKAANVIKAQRTRELILSQAGLAPPGSGMPLMEWLLQCQKEAEEAKQVAEEKQEALEEQEQKQEQQEKRWQK